MSEPKETNEPKARKLAKRRKPRAKTLEVREKQNIRLAMDLAEKQMREGTATSQVITHFLKLGSISEGLVREKIRHENKLLEAKTEALESTKRIETLYEEALNAMREYSGHGRHIDEDEDE